MLNYQRVDDLCLEHGVAFLIFSNPPISSNFFLVQGTKKCWHGQAAGFSYDQQRDSQRRVWFPLGTDLCAGKPIGNAILDGLISTMYQQYHHEKVGLGWWSRMTITFPSLEWTPSPNSAFICGVIALMKGPGIEKVCLCSLTVHTLKHLSGYSSAKWQKIHVAIDPNASHPNKAYKCNIGVS